jgi:hypothetical protein
MILALTIAILDRLGSHFLREDYFLHVAGYSIAKGTSARLGAASILFRRSRCVLNLFSTLCASAASRTKQWR